MRGHRLSKASLCRSPTVPGYVGAIFTGGRALSVSATGDALCLADSFPNTTLEWRDLTGNRLESRGVE